MKIFISWSGEKSHKVAIALHDWLPKVHQVLSPFVSSVSIRKGKQWLKEITASLESSNVGIIILTKKNHAEPWINFEAGALFKQGSVSLICTLLVDIAPENISGPLTMFQASRFDKEEMKKLLYSINEEAPISSRLKEKILDEAFEKWWPDLENRVQKAISEIHSDEDENLVQPQDNSALYKRLNFLINKILFENLTNDMNARLWDLRNFLLEHEEIINDKIVIEYFQKWLAPLSSFDLHGGLDPSWREKFPVLKKETDELKQALANSKPHKPIERPAIQIDIIKFIADSGWPAFHSVDVAKKVNKKEVEVFHHMELLEEQGLLRSESFDNGNTAFFLTKDGRKFIVDNGLL